MSGGLSISEGNLYCFAAKKSIKMLTARVLMWYFHLIRYLSQVGSKVIPVEIKTLATPINRNF